MSSENKKFYVTTPIYYVNARPHIGHAYTTIVADVLARRHRLLGEDTFFLTGTDEHGQKIARSAAAAGIPPQQFADEVSDAFQSLWQRMGLLHDSFSKDDSLFHRKFIRTTDPAHARGVQKLFSELYARGFIELKAYTGTYCVSDEVFVDVPAGAPCPDCGRPTETVTEENFFFKLSEFQKPLLELIESNTLLITPDSRRNEVLSFLRGGLKDLSISRSSFTWGIPVPEPAASEAKQKHVIYVWLDALANYMTAIGYGSDDPKDIAEFAKYWPADLHLVGKEIIRFHCVYWPAFLLALNPALQQPTNLSSRPEAQSAEAERPAVAPAQLPPEAHAAWAKKMLPKAITAHGWLLFDNAKMSKSKGNIVRTETILEAFGEHVYGKQFPESTKRERDLFASDVLRYFLLREIPFGQDGSFSFEAMVTRYNADLANGYGNLVSRTLAMIQRYCSDTIPIIDTVNLTDLYDHSLLTGDLIYLLGVRSRLADIGVRHQDRNLLQAAIGIPRVPPIADLAAYLLQNSDFGLALEKTTKFISGVDAYITAVAPWSLAKSTSRTKQLSGVLYVAAESIRIITALLYPVLPYATARVWSQLGLGDIEVAARNGELNNMQWGGLKPGTKLGPLAPIFPRAPKELADIMSELEENNTPAAQSSQLTADKPTQPQAHLKLEPNPPAGAPALVPPTEETVKPAQITIDDFAKIELRVAQIVVAERIPKADKLLRLEVDLGPEFPARRQILSGIAEWYTPEELLGRRIVVITNLAPRKMRGLESHGMLLAASEGEGGKPILATFSEDIALGSRLK
ncbi:MAG TPA: methionine--tRNA ligase subunit beta [Acidobacteriaceae bacterium]